MANTRENPYVGPRAFRLADQKLFAGRDRDILALYRQLIADRIVLLFSPSGAGKSSLVNAGLLPRMIDKGFKVFPVVRVNDQLPDSLPKNDKANRYVMSMLQSLEVDRIDRTQVPSAEHLQAGGQAFSMEELSTLTIDDYLTQRLCPDGPQDDEEEEIVEPRSLLIFDQFEEILTIDPNDHKGKREFFAQLGEALEASRRWALFVVREDHVAALEPYRRFLPTRLAQTYRLDLLDDQSAMEAIRKPASLKGMNYTDAAAQLLVDELRKVRIQAPNGDWEPEPQLGRYVEPVQLQVVCYRLWGKVDEDDTITEEEVSKLGSVDDSLAAFYAEKVTETEEKIGVSQKDIRTWFDTKLITLTNIRSQVMWEKDESGGLRNDAILFLEKTHLIRRESRRGIRWLELAHDRLIKPVRDSNREWFEHNLSPLQRHAMLWAAEGEPDRLLLRDDEFATAEAWAKNHTLSPNEQKFLDACIDLRERIQGEASRREAEALAARNKVLDHLNKRLRNLFRGAIVATVAAVLLAGLAIWSGIRANNYAGRASISAAEAADRARSAALSARQATLREQEAIKARELAEAQTERANRESSFATASQLAAESIIFTDTDPKRAILLALEALNVTQSQSLPTVPVAEEALRAALGAQSGILLSGHNGQIKSIAISNDEHWLATADSHGYIRIWDLSQVELSDSKWLLRELGGSFITHVMFSPDGKYLVAGDTSGNLYIWELPAGPSEEPFVVHAENLNTSQIGPGVLEGISAIAVSLDGNWLAASSSGGKVNLYDFKSGSFQPITLLRSGVENITVLEFSPDSSRLAAGSEDHLARLWAVDKPQNTPASMLAEGIVSGLDFSPDGGYLAIASEQILYFWNTNAPANTPDTYQQTASKITVLAFDPKPSTAANGSNQQQLFVGRADGSIEVWRGNRNTFAIPSGEDILQVIDSEITHFSFSPDGHWLLTGSKDRLARLFDLTDLSSPPRILRRFDDPITATVISSKGAWLSVSSDNNEARLWDLKAGFDTLEPLSLPGGAFALDPAGDRLFTAPVKANQPLILTWNFSDLNHLEKISTEIKSDAPDRVPVTTLSISSDGRWLATCDASGKLRITNLQNSTVALTELKGNLQPCWQAEFTPDGRYLVMVTDEQGKGVIKVWETDFAGTAPRTIDPPHEGYITSLAFSADGKWMATGSNGGTENQGVAVLWNLEDLSGGSPTLIIPDHIGWVNTIAFSQDGQWLATGDDGGSVRFKDLSDLEAPTTLVPAHEGLVTVVKFSPDSQSFASGGSDGTIRIWLVQPGHLGENVFIFRGHGGSISDLAFSPDNKRLVSAGSDNTVRLWDWLNRSRDAVVLKGYGDTVTDVGFTADGRWLVTGSNDGTNRLWNLDLNQLEELACQVVGRNFTEKEWNQFFAGGAGLSEGNSYRETCPQYDLVNNLESDEVVSAVPTIVDVIPATGPQSLSPPLLCSEISDVPVNVTFTNNSDKTVDVYWVDYNCESVFYRSLLPGESYEQGTFTTHPWIFIDAEAGEVLKEFVVDTPDEEVTIP